MRNNTLWEDLKSAIDQAANRVARLHWVDLHVHSPESHDFQDATCQFDPSDHTEQAAWFLEQIQERAPDLRVVGVADHFKCRTACEAARLASDLDILLLPGIEMAVRCTEFHEDKIHVIVIFPPDSGPEMVYGIVQMLGGPRYEDAGAGSYISQQLSELFEEANRCGALCIAAHVNTSQGIRDFVRKTSLELVPAKRRERELLKKAQRTPEEETELSQLKERLRAAEEGLQNRYLTFLGTTKVAAVQVAAADDVPYYTREHCEPLGVRPIACLVASDAHSPRELATYGKATFLRMGELSFRGVRAALGDPETRIRFERPATERTIMKGLRFVPPNGTSEDFWGDTTVAFSENLTCIIGPRGSGKSAVIEAIRFALDKSQLGDSKLQEDAQGRLQATIANTTVQLWMSPGHQDDLMVQRQLNAEPQAYDLTGNPVDLHFPTSEATHVTVYGWSEMEQLGKNWAAQRDILDGAAPELQQLQSGAAQARSALQSNRSDVVAAARQIADYNSELGTLADVRRQLEKLDTLILRKAFEATDRAGGLEDIISTAEADLIRLLDGLVESDTQQPADLAAALEEWISNLRADTQEQALDLPASLTSPEFKTVSSQLLAALRQTHASLAAFLLSVTEAKQAVITSREEAQRQAEMALLEAFREDIQARRETEESVKHRAEQREQLQNRYNDLLAIKRTRNEERTRLDELLAQRYGQLLPAFVGALRQLSDWRRRKARAITKRLMEFAARAPISVDVVALADRSAFARRLYDAERDEGIPKGSKVHAFSERRLANGLAQAFLPWEFAQAIRGEQTEQLREVFERDERGDASLDAERLVDHLSVGQADGDYDPDKLDTLLEIEEIMVDDRPQIMLEDAAIEDLSPGQRCTALMPIVLTEGDWPLIIDQPEDALDNTMGFQVLVDMLRQLKDKRPVIVATHNPNVPVSGDAEQVVVLQSKTRREGEVVGQGALDLADIIRHITRLMEGGEEAFEIRARKYGYDIRRATYSD